jgi:ATP-dependent Clp protease ATP-binding subunit ClpA
VSINFKPDPAGGRGIGNAMMSDFTPRGQQVLALARQEAERFNHHYVGTEHLLLGLIKLGQGVAVRASRSTACSATN